MSPDEYRRSGRHFWRIICYLDTVLGYLADGLAIINGRLKCRRQKIS